MSDTEVATAIRQMEAWVADPAWAPDPEALVRWNGEYQSALARAEKGPGWADLIARAHAVGRAVEARTIQFEALRDGMRVELEAQERGNRALRGYGASTR
jgi:hypothetical protein